MITVSHRIMQMYHSSRGVVGWGVLGTNIGYIQSRGGEGSDGYFAVIRRLI